MGYLVRLASIIGAAALFVGCGTSQPPIGAPGAMVQSRAIGSQMRFRSAIGRRGGGPSMEALFYAFGRGKMAIFKVSFHAWPYLRKLVGIPYVNLHGACSDPSGHVFVTQSGTSGSGEVIEFVHGDTSAVATLSDTGSATACSYDRSTGNLAVANSYDADAPGGPGPDIAVYANEAGTPTLYADPLADSIRSCSYDLSGNLFIGGTMRHGRFVLTELPRGSATVKAVTIDGVLGGEYRIEDVQWHQGSLFVTSTDPRRDHGTRISVLNIRGSTGTIAGTIKLHTVSSDEKATGPWVTLFAGYVVTADRIGVAAWRIPLHCIGTCVKGNGDRHQARIASGFVSITASAIRPDEGKL